MLRESEVVVLLLAIFDLTPLRPEFAVRTALLVGKELFLANAVVSPLLRLVELILVEQPLQNFLNTIIVTLLGSCGPAIVFLVQLLPKRHELFSDRAHEFRRRDALFLG